MTGETCLDISDKVEPCRNAGNIHSKGQRRIAVVGQLGSLRSAYIHPYWINKGRGRLATEGTFGNNGFMDFPHNSQ
jgi:hypothetical protein